MRNTITLNGISSATITGLLIQELPPISKPRVRTLTEEIDGRDGDIVTKLGYSAYDKEVSIGLHGDFDIDEVINFFNSEGEVIFSNESDKYYRYQILDQIDFERLLRFRTAIVRMHVQPFKYSATETKQTFNNPSGSVTIANSGNIYSRPQITIHGTGEISLALGGNQIFNITLGEEDDYITIDVDEMEAYTDTLDTLRNRDVDGDYQNARFNVGSNSLTWTGNVTKIEIEHYSRWI